MTGGGVGGGKLFELGKPAPVQLYRFVLDSFQIMGTMARHEDTDSVAFTMAIGKSTPITQTRAIGNVNNGTFQLGMTYDLAVADDETAVLIYSIVNNGHNDPSTVEKVLNQGASEIGQKAADAAASTVAGGLGAAFEELLGTLLGAAAGAGIGALFGGTCRFPRGKARQSYFHGLRWSCRRACPCFHRGRTSCCNHSGTQANGEPPNFGYESAQWLPQLTLQRHLVGFSFAMIQCWTP